MMDDAMEDNSEDIEAETEAEIDKACRLLALALHACLKGQPLPGCRATMLHCDRHLNR